MRIFVRTSPITFGSSSIVSLIPIEVAIVLAFKTSKRHTLAAEMGKSQKICDKKSRPRIVVIGTPLSFKSLVVIGIKQVAPAIK